MTSIRTRPTSSEIQLADRNASLAFGWMLVTAEPRNYPFQPLSQRIQLHDGSWAQNVIATLSQLDGEFSGAPRGTLKAHYLLRDGIGQAAAYPAELVDKRWFRATGTTPCKHFTV